MTVGGGGGGEKVWRDGVGGFPSKSWDEVAVGYQYAGSWLAGKSCFSPLHPRGATYDKKYKRTRKIYFFFHDQSRLERTALKLEWKALLSEQSWNQDASR